MLQLALLDWSIKVGFAAGNGVVRGKPGQIAWEPCSAGGRGFPPGGLRLSGVGLPRAPEGLGRGAYVVASPAGQVFLLIKCTIALLV